VSGIFTEQGFVDRLVSRIVDRFRWVPAWRKWLEFREGVWQDWLAAERLQKEYLAEVGEPDEKPTGRRGWSVANARSESSQAAAMRLLSKEPLLLSRPEEFGDNLAPRPILPPFPSLAETMGLSNLAFGLSYEGNRDALEDWTLRARGRVESSPNALIRTDYRASDLGSLFPLFSKELGPYVVRVSPQTWTHFPKSLTPELAWQLTGTCVCFLEGEENHVSFRKFAQIALKRWLTWGQAEWTGHDGVRYCLSLPLFYVVAGPDYPRGFHNGMSEHLVEIKTEERREWDSFQGRSVPVRRQKGENR
jgi:hypothetical protein